jgi:hypothetical protein
VTKIDYNNFTISLFPIEGIWRKGEGEPENLIPIWLALPLFFFSKVGIIKRQQKISAQG